MANGTKPETTISDSAIQKATGKDWAAWITLLDAAGAREWEHPRRAKFLAETQGLSGWWSQMVTVGYEYARDLRTAGQTAEVGFEVGAQRTLPLGQAPLWDLLVSPPGLRHWLGQVASLPTVGDSYTTAEGTVGTLKVLNPPHHLRMTWQPAGWAAPATLQARLLSADGERTSLRFHVEKLISGAEREHMRARLQTALDWIAGLIDADRR